ncbi:MAG: hypothetical protein RL518_1660 [Pseudomonadota bacterium]|jgi:hypothetical protein
MFEKLREPRAKSWTIGLLSLVLVVAFVGYLVEGRRTVSLPPLLRITTDPTSKVQHLEVPLLRYTKGTRFKDQVVVDFVGAVHLGEKSYYGELNKRFTSYDAVLFELVSDGADLPTMGEDSRDSLLGTVQRAFSNLLGLSFQLDEVNYRAKNFIHADLSPEELSDAMSARGESLPQLLMKLIKLSTDPEIKKALEKQGYKEGSLDGVNPLLILLRGPTQEDRIKIRRFMAQGLIGSDAVLKVLEGEKGFSLITDRNKEVMAVLNKETSHGKRKIAIFYGVGHLPDLHKRLTEQGYRLAKVEWLAAWNM